jgi:hypothetical protein
MRVRGPRYVSSGLVKFLKRWAVPWYLLTVVLYAACIPATIFVFPSTTLLLTVFVLFGGFTASVASLASALISADQDKALASVENEVTPDDEEVRPPEV